MPLLLPDSPERAPSLSNPATFEPDNSAMLAWFKLLVDTMKSKSVLVAGDNGLGSAITPPPLSNVDATDTPIGWYLFTNGAGTVPSDGNPFACVRIDRYNSDTFRQTWIGYRGGHYTRFCDRGTFGPWVNLAIQSGSNAGGEWVRFPDGTQECRHVLSASASAGVVWTFPAVFSAAPVVTGTAQAGVSSSVVRDLVPSATSVTISARDKADARRADTVHLTAKGRWY